MAITLWYGDCFPVMEALPAGSVNLIYADMPFNVTDEAWDRQPVNLAGFWARAHRLLAPHGMVVLHAIQPFTTTLITSNPKEFRFIWIWDKKLPSGLFNAKRRPLRRHEDLVVFSRDRKFTYNPQMRVGPMRRKGGGKTTNHVYATQTFTESRNNLYYPTTILEFSGANQAKKRHPTEKPEALARYIIRTHSDPGDVVLDPYVGSGTVLAAAAAENRVGIGIENDLVNWRIASQRIAHLNPVLAGPYPHDPTVAQAS